MRKKPSCHFSEQAVQDLGVVDDALDVHRGHTERKGRKRVAVQVDALDHDNDTEGEATADQRRRRELCCAVQAALQRFRV